MECLNSQIIPAEDLTGDLVGQMFTLFSAAFDHVDRERFLADLSWKDEVILLRDESEAVRGFTTLAFNPKGYTHPEGDVLFSGDTIIDPSCWGNSELVRAFCQRAGQWRQCSQRRLYWMLISKGHRTFLYLPLFARRFFPHPNRDEPLLEEIAGDVSKHLFEDCWYPSEGVVRFDRSLGQLKPELVEATWQRSDKSMVRYFIERNPGFASGDELVCLTELDENNLKRVALKGFNIGQKGVLADV